MTDITDGRLPQLRGPVHYFLDWDNDKSLINEFLSLLPGNIEAAKQHAVEHTGLPKEEVAKLIDDIIEDGDFVDDDRADEACEKLHDAMRRTPEEILAAWFQVFDRVRYGRGLVSHEPKEFACRRGTCPECAHRKQFQDAYPDIDDDKYYEQFGWGYLAGVMSALHWVGGGEWAMLDT